MEGRFVNIVIPTRNEYLTLCEVEVTGEPVENNPTAVVNIAKGRNVVQSSIGFGGSPQRAVDGNRASDWLKGSCTHTNNDKRPWWRLDLEKRYKINTVTIHNRRDCCSNRLNGAEIRIGDLLDDNGNANPRCTVISSIPAGNSHTFQCKEMEGRFVNIVIPNRKEYLTLCEVEVTGEPAENISTAGRTVAQSSIGFGGSPQRAVDGNHASDWHQGSCTHTNNDRRPWWRLDLEKRYKINTVTITNRRDCCSNRLNGAEIRIGDRLDDNGNANPRCTVISSIPAGNSQTFQCKGMEGRYVNIVIPNRKEYLTLCEVEVTGEPAGNNPRQVNIARGGTVAQSSIYGGAGPQRAVDGNRASDWNQGSCTHTNKDRRPWWRLDLEKRYKINTVTIHNRRDCCSNRLNGAEIRIGDRLDDNGNANPRCTVISSIPAGNSQTFQCKGMEGRYMNIVIPNRKEYLTLCEVEVTGEPAENIPAAVVNIARGRTVAQSSIGFGGDPQRAVDGNRASDWHQGSCTHTNKDRHPWWRLDLEKRYKINTITIYNRRDCCSNRLNGAEIRIGDRLDDHGNANPRCTVISSIPAGSSRTFQCKGMEGRFVNIVIPTRNEYLTLCEVEVTGEPVENNPTAVVNIARGRTVAQSSIGFGGSPQRAVDGNRASDWLKGSCTHTNNDKRPWWRLDLEKRYKINTVTITNRRDCCSNRLNGAEIRIGDSLDDNGNANPRCTVISSIPAGNSQTFQCKGMEGRYVNIVIPNRKEYLTLCEVEVTIVNIARGRTVAQSSIYSGAGPQRAIDGNRASDWSQGSCTHTNKDKRPWWRLDLEKRYKISTVTITNRRDCCCNRLNGAEIRIGDRLDDNGNANPRCAVISSIPAGNSQTFQCKGMKGRYVSIVIPNRNEYLTLCEVEVSGEPADSNIARGGKVAQSSIYGGAGPQRAVDGNHASNWSQGSCTHTDLDMSPWWRLDLDRRFKIYTVTITNRGDCCSNRLNGAEIHIGDRLDDNGNANPRCTVITAIQAGDSQTFVCNGMEGRFINIVIPNKKQYLTLCEVEVSGDEILEETDVLECN
ncbi:uncharacterized protein LOC141800603 [Halichoeres trimaculatus]|uniref:uncharacterized protein LOC141800603 n=1 Tax=Halichoeres trimaculatus TaxID=147232 RepID=UPI003D9E31EA